MKKLISLFLALTLAVLLTVPAVAEKTMKIGELAYLNSDGTLRSGMLVEALKAIRDYSGGFQIFGNGYKPTEEKGIVNADDDEEITDVIAVEYLDMQTMLRELDAGLIDGMIVYYSVGKYICQQRDDLTSWLDFDNMDYFLEGMNIKNRFILDQVMGTDFSFMMMEDHAELRDEFNRAIADMKADGTLDALHASMMDTEKGVEIEKIEGAETVKVGVTGDLPPMDFTDELDVPAGFNTAVLSEISKRIGKNIELVKIYAGARSIALNHGLIDVVFWSRVSAPDKNLYDLIPEKRKLEASIISAAVSLLRHPDIDIPESTIVTDPYYHDLYITIFKKQ